MTTVKHVLSVSLYEGIIFLSYFKEKKKKLNIKKRWDHLPSVNAKHWTSLLQNMLHFMAKKTGRFLHMKEMSLLSITMNWAYGHAPHTGDTFAFVGF